MSVSSYKKYKHCEYAGTKPFGEPTPSMLIGSYVDAWIEGTLDEFREEHPNIYSSRGKTKGMLKSEFKLAEEICRYIENDKVFMQFMSGDKQTVMTGEIEGVPFKIKMDSYSKGVAINDLKVMADVTNRRGEFIDFITPWGYDIQMACYQEIVYQNTGERLPTFICAVEKKKPLNSAIVQIPQYHLDAVLFEVKQRVERYYQIRQGLIIPDRCGKCKTCISEQTETKIMTLEDLI